MEWIPWLFDAGAFVTRDRCGDWGGALPRAYQAASLVIALCYLAIPAGLLRLWLLRRRTLVAPSMYLMFATFITLCGLTHLLDVLAFYWPAYRAFTGLLVLTAVASAATLAMAPAAAARVMSLPTPEEYAKTLERLNLEAAAREAMERQSKAHIANLTREADEMRDLILRLQSRRGMEDIALAMREQLHKIRGA